MITNSSNDKDPLLWQMAKKRTAFKRHLFTYIIVNAFLWAIWFFDKDNQSNVRSFPWPFWTTVGWGVGVAFHYAGAYLFSQGNAVEKEYEKLKNKQNNKN
jgi:hypothetical protein